ncbi:MAG: hypothetical protein IPJ00_15985 [Saprospirales bacterium]|nr:hypothetical protein [Saprospirales bacterium]
MGVKPYLYTYVPITFLLLFANLTAGAQDFKSEAFLDLDLNGLVAGRLHFPDLPDHLKGEVSFVVYACLDSTGKVTEAKLLEQDSHLG